MLSLDVTTRAMMALTHHHVIDDGRTLFSLLNYDVESAAMSFQLFDEQLKLKFELRSGMFSLTCHAGNFVCAVRRVGRLLDRLAASGDLRRPVLDAIRLERKKKRAFFESFLEPRNAIEHID